MTSALGAVLGEDHVCYYPAWETLPHERLSPCADTVGRRLKVLRRLGGTDDQPLPDVVVAPIRSMLQPQVKGLKAIRPVQLRQGQEYDQRALVADLVAAAYSRVDLVERRGEFAVRGGTSTSSRRPSSIPCGWTSSATRSTRCATSPCRPALHGHRTDRG